jgi:hypothetical protein
MEMGFTIIFQAISDACNGNVFTAQQTRQFLDGECSELSTPMTNGGVDSDPTGSVSVWFTEHIFLFFFTHLKRLRVQCFVQTNFGVKE